MDITTFVAFIGGGSLVATLLVDLLKSSLKGISEKYGALATQALLLIVSIVLSLIITSSSYLPESWLVVSGQIFTGAMVIYEVFVKAIWKQAING